MTLHLILKYIFQAKLTYFKAKVASVFVLRHCFSDDPILATYVKTLDRLILTNAFVLRNFTIVCEIRTPVFLVFASKLE